MNLEFQDELSPSCLRELANIDEMKYMPPMPMVISKKPNTKVVITSRGCGKPTLRMKQLLELYEKETYVVPLYKEDKTDV